MSGEYYFVSFGREPGGYLDYLGLAPSATDGEIGQKERIHRQDVEQKVRETRKLLKAREKKGEITPEELQAEIEKADQEKSKTLARLNDLKRAYDLERAQRRGLAASARALAGGGWRELFRSFSLDALWEMLLQRQPLDAFEADHILQVRRRWFGLSAAMDASTFSRLASSRYRSGHPVDLSTISGLVAERDLIHLMAADLLWQQLSLTNRDYWREQVRRWAAEIEDLGPKLRHDALVKPGGMDTWEYPHLCRPKNPMIDKLEAGKTQDFSQGPKRPTRMPETMDLRTLLELLARLESQEPDAQPEIGDLAGGRLGAKALLDLLLGGLKEATPGEEATPKQDNTGPGKEEHSERKTPAGRKKHRGRT